MPEDSYGSQLLNPWQAWLSMFGLRAPLSGNVAQDIAPSIGGQLGLLNINTTSSGNPELEHRIVTQVASYGRQLGRLIEAVNVLAQHQSRHDLGEAEIHALDQLQKLAEQIAAVKEHAAREHIDRIVGDVRTLSKNPEANAEAIRRIRKALPQE
jgi:hypothetical protein